MNESLFYGGKCLFLLLLIWTWWMMLVIWCKDTIWANIWRTISCGWQICPWIIQFERECVFAILFWLQVKLSFLHKCCLPVNVWLFVLQTLSKNHLNHLMTNQQYGCTNNMAVRPAKTQISLGIRPVWSESSLSAWRKVGTLATHWTCWTHSEGSEMSEIEPVWDFQCYRNKTGSYLKSFSRW